jgi:hypothetical protein
MGWGGFGGIGSAFKKLGGGLGDLFSNPRKGIKEILSIGPGTKTFMQFLDKDLYEDVTKGVGNLLTGGYISQREANKIMKKNARQAEQQYRDAIQRAEAQQKALSDLEKRRKLLLAKFGNQTPKTLLGSYLGLPDEANVQRPTLG